MNTTVVIVTFKSKPIIASCLNSIDSTYPIIIVENSEDINFKEWVESKYPNVKCCLDISHAYINCTYRNVHFINEIKELASNSEHIHMHDSFGLIEKIWAYIPAEYTSYGQGDLHLPLGWGDIPFNEIFNMSANAVKSI